VIPDPHRPQKKPSARRGHPSAAIDILAQCRGEDVFVLIALDDVADGPPESFRQLSP
jgi:hypothetical protein